MPTKGVKSPVPHSDLADRSEGWGMTGRAIGYNGFSDDGIWPSVVVRNNPLPDEQPETSHGDWYRNGSLI